MGAWLNRSINEEGGHGVTELGWIGAGFYEDIGNAVAAEIRTAEDEIAAAIGEGAALVVEAQAELDVSGQI